MSLDGTTPRPSALGVHGAALGRLHALALPTVPAVAVTTEAWREWEQAGRRMPPAVARDLRRAVGALREASAGPPAILSLRPSPLRDAPPPVGPVHGLGLNAAIAEQSASPLAERRYVELLRWWAGVVLGVRAEEILACELATGSATPRVVAARLRDLIAQRSGRPFPHRISEQVEEAVEAVWRAASGGPVAVVLQATVLDASGERSGSGVVLTRDPMSGSPGAVGRFTSAADVGAAEASLTALHAELPRVFQILDDAVPLVEAAFRDMCEIEFVVDRGDVRIADVHAAERSGVAALRIAVDLVDEALIDVDEALRRIPLTAMEKFQAPVFARDQELDVFAHAAGVAAGAAIGTVVLDAPSARRRAAAGKDVVLVLPDTAVVDTDVLRAVRAVVTAGGDVPGSMTRAAQAMGQAVVCHLPGATIDPVRGTVRSAAGAILQEGDEVSVDGRSGVIARGRARIVPAQPGPRIARLLQWCEEARRIPVTRAAPGAWGTIATPGEAPQAVRGRAVIDVARGGAVTPDALRATMASAAAAGVREFALRLPDAPLHQDLELPPAPWAMIVAPAHKTWAAALLAARVPIAPVSVLEKATVAR